jgi:hypothetical protein
VRKEKTDNEMLSARMTVMQTYCVRLHDGIAVNIELSDYRQVIMLICLSTVKEVC